ncbi:hypothetical protein LDENG_00104590 [Lucifuga dentata]|nr:hypothetical protein LDENG_00104590 [Lucifuga dentata]
MRRLARGSGWIRVNLDLDFLDPIRKDENEEFEFEVDTLVESDSEVFVSNFDEDAEKVESENARMGQEDYRNWNKAMKSGTVSQNEVSHEEDTVDFSPSQEEEEEEGAPDVGVGAVLSLLCLSTLLFLANCLPCVLRDRRKRSKQEEEERRDRGATEEEADEQERQKARGQEAEEKKNQEEHKRQKHEGSSAEV